MTGGGRVGGDDTQSESERDGGWKRESGGWGIPKKKRSDSGGKSTLPVSSIVDRFSGSICPPLDGSFLGNLSFSNQ